MAVGTLAMPCPGGAQPDTAWVRRFDGDPPYQDDLRALAIDQEGQVFVTGRVWTSAAGFDIATIKYSPEGDTQWVRLYGGSANVSDNVQDLALDASGNAYVTGSAVFDTIMGTDTIYYGDLVTLKYSHTGDLLWDRRHGTLRTCCIEGTAVAIDNSGYIYVTGYSATDAVTRDAIVTLKYTPDGDTVWVRRFDEPGDQRPVDLVVNADGDVYVTGPSDRGHTTSDFLTIKYDATGNELWVRRYNGPGDQGDLATAMALDDSGSVYVTGTSWGGGFPEGPVHDYATIKYSPGGDTLWVRRFNGPADGPDEAYALVIDSRGNAIVTGASSGGLPVDGLTGWDYATVKYSTHGDLLWAQRYSFEDTDKVGRNDYALALAVDEFDNIYVTGESAGIPETYGGSGYDYATVKYSETGEHLWVARYNGPGGSGDIGVGVAVDGGGNVYVAGSSIGVGTNLDYATIKYRYCPVEVTGNVTADHSIRAQDIIALVDYVFKGGSVPLPCAAAGDVNCDTTVSSADIIYVVNHVFKSGPAPCAVCVLIPGTWSCP